MASRWLLTALALSGTALGAAVGSDFAMNFLDGPALEARGDQGTPLRPLSHRDIGISKRDRHQSVQLRSQDTMYWVSEDSANSSYFATMTMEMPEEDENFINLEHVAGLASKIKCKDNEIVIKFDDEADYDAAGEMWEWVNTREQRFFLAVVGPEECGNLDDRQPYRIKKVVWKEEKLKIKLKGRQVSWRESAHTWEMRVGGVDMGLSELRKRRIGSRLKKAVKKAVKKVKDVAKDVGDSIKDVAQDAGDAIKDVAQDAGEAIKDTAINIGDKVDNALDKAMEKLEDFGETLGDAGKDFIDDLKDIDWDWAEDALAVLEDIAPDVVDWTRDQVEDFVDKWKQLAENVGALVSLFATGEGTFDMDLGMETNFHWKFKELQTGNKPGIEVDAECLDCRLGGHFKADAVFKMKNFKVEEANLTLRPEDFGMYMRMRLALKLLNKGSKREGSKAIKEKALYGLLVPGLVQIGPAVKAAWAYEFSELKFSIATVLGGSVAFDNDARIYIDFKDPSKSDVSGWTPRATWDGPDFLTDVDLSIDARFLIFFKISVDVGVSVPKLGATLELGWKMPYLDAKASAVISPGCNFCSENEELGYRSGLKLGSNLGIEGALKMKAGKDTLRELKFLNLELLKLFSMCFPTPFTDMCPRSVDMENAPN